jgi:hypothetical protein
VVFQVQVVTFVWSCGGPVPLGTGALDGLLFANTYGLPVEHNLGWKGILVEASPSSYGALRVNRPGQVTMHVAVCKESQVVHYADGGADCCRGIAEFLSKPFLERWHGELVNGDFSSLPTVRCEPLAYILGTVGVQHINFYSLDVEGGELMVLESVDFSKISFDVLTIEADGGNGEKDQGVIDLLARHGYKHHGHVANNDWFVREGFIASSAPGVAAW